MATLSPFLLIHICAATIALLSGVFAVFLRKGSGWHAAAGTVFFVSMLAMTSSGLYVALFERLNRLNVMMSIFTFYLVATAWVAARRRERKVSLFDWAALLIVLGDAVMAFTWGFQSSSRTAPVFFVFGSLIWLCVFADIRMIRRGGVAGGQRITRHLWRMCFAMWIALMSFYPGQARLFPDAWRKSGLLLLPGFLLLGYMLFSLWRRRRSMSLVAS